jgi:hypothetical protein
MRFTLAIVVCMLACCTSALAQNGITNTRDGYGNLVRNTGMNPVRGTNQPPGNNPNGAIASAPGPTTPINSRLNKSTGK